MHDEHDTDPSAYTLAVTAAIHLVQHYPQDPMTVFAMYCEETYYREMSLSVDHHPCEILELGPPGNSLELHTGPEVGTSDIPPGSSHQSGPITTDPESSNHPSAARKSRQAWSGAMTVRLRRKLSLDLPQIARSLVGSKDQLLETISWAPAAGRHSSRHAEWSLEVEGVPASVNGTLVLSSLEEGSQLELDAKVSVHIPILGSRIESLVATNLSTAIQAEHRFDLSYLAEGSSGDHQPNQR